MGTATPMAITGVIRNGNRILLQPEMDSSGLVCRPYWPHLEIHQEPQHTIRNVFVRPLNVLIQYSVVGTKYTVYFKND